MKKEQFEFIKKYLATADNIFNSLEDIKRSDGLLGKNEYWNYGC